MADQARVTSLEAIEAFRNQMILFRERAGRVLDEVTEHLARTRNWLEQDRATHWQHEIRRLQRELEQRQQELFSARLSAFRDTPLAEQVAVQRARQALESAQDRARRVRFWQQQFEPRVQPLARQIEKLRSHLNQDLARALAYLTEIHRTLAAYAELEPGSASLSRPAPEPPPAPATAPTSSGPSQP